MPYVMRGAAVAAVVPIAVLLLVTDGCLKDSDPPASRLLALDFDRTYPLETFDYEYYQRLLRKREREARQKGRQTCRVTWRELLAAAGRPLSTPYSTYELRRTAELLGTEGLWANWAFVEGCEAAFLSFLSSGGNYEEP